MEHDAESVSVADANFSLLFAGHFFLSSNTTLTRCHLLAGWDCGLLIYAHGKLTGQHAAGCFKAPVSLFFIHKGAEKTQQRAETQITGMNNM